MTASTSPDRTRGTAALRRFARTPKGLMTLALLVLIGAAGLSTGFARIGSTLLAAVLTAAVIDLPILRARSRWWVFPDGAVLTGLFVAMVLSAFEPWYVAAATSAVAVISKYVVRGRTANVFNPAAVGLVVTFYVIGTGQDWWGALPDAGLVGLVLLFAVGVFIVDRVNKMPLALSFLGFYFLLFTATAFVGEPRLVAEIFRPPDVNAVLFFAFFILTDPPTSPAKYRDQVVCGLLVAVASFVIFEVTGAAHYLLSGVLIGNVWEAWRRQQADARRASIRQRARTEPAAGRS
jgi:Na+-translocating ferredoxin:NAD+ oxidoreductase RnfD subunit